MAHYAVICPDDAGHLLSVGPIGTELARRGHRVTLVAGQRGEPFAQRLGLGFRLLDPTGVAWKTSHLSWAAFWLVGMPFTVELRDKFAWQSRVLLERLPAILADLQVDGALIDQTLPAGGTAAARAGVPFVTICSALLWNEEPDVPPPFTAWAYSADQRSRMRNRLGYAGWHWFIGPALNVINRYRRRWNLPTVRRVDELFSPRAQISQLCREFDFPRRKLPPAFHYIGSLASDRPVAADQGFPWDRLDGRRLVYASLGTDPYGSNLAVYRKIVQAVDGLDAQVVLALGRWNEKLGSQRELLGAIPDHVIAVDFAPQLALLDRAALLVTHAGVNTVLEAMCRAVPMVALPRAVDQPGMAARIAQAGLGRVGSFWRATPAEIRALIDDVLAEEAYRRRAQAMRHAMLAAGGLVRAADLAEAACAPSAAAGAR